MEPHYGGWLVPEPLSMVGSNRIKGHLMEGKGVHGEFRFCRKYSIKRKAFDGWPALRGEGIEPFGRRGRVSRRRFYLTFLDHCHDFNAR